MGLNVDTINGAERAGRRVFSLSLSLSLSFFTFIFPPSSSPSFWRRCRAIQSYHIGDHWLVIASVSSCIESPNRSATASIFHSPKSILLPKLRFLDTFPLRIRHTEPLALFACSPASLQFRSLFDLSNLPTIVPNARLLFFFFFFFSFFFSSLSALPFQSQISHRFSLFRSLDLVRLVTLNCCWSNWYF